MIRYKVTLNAPHPFKENKVCTLVETKDYYFYDDFGIGADGKQTLSNTIDKVLKVLKLEENVGGITTPCTGNCLHIYSKNDNPGSITY